MTRKRAGVDAGWCKSLYLLLVRSTQRPAITSHFHCNQKNYIWGIKLAMKNDRSQPFERELDKTNFREIRHSSVALCARDKRIEGRRKSEVIVKIRENTPQGCKSKPSRVPKDESNYVRESKLLRGQTKMEFTRARENRGRIATALFAKAPKVIILDSRGLGRRARKEIPEFNP